MEERVEGVWQQLAHDEDEMFGICEYDYICSYSVLPLVNAVWTRLTVQLSQEASTVQWYARGRCLIWTPHA